MLEPCNFPSLDNCQKRFPWIHKDVGPAPHPVVGLVLQVGDAEKFPQALGFQSLDPFFQSASRVHVSQPWRMEVTRDLYTLNLLAKLMAVAPPDPVRLVITATAEAILMRTSAEQVPFLHRVALVYLKLVTSANF